MKTTYPSTALKVDRPFSRTFQLFEYIGITQTSKPGLIPYYLKDIDNVCPSYFNDISKCGDVWAEGMNPDDPYKINCGLAPNGQIPAEYGLY